MGSNQIFSVGMPISLAVNISSAVIAPLSLASRGIPSLPHNSPMKSASCCLTIGNSSSILTKEMELISALPLCTFSPASIATGFVVSRDSGKSVTSCTVLTTHSINSSPLFRAGPMLTSR